MMFVVLQTRLAFIAGAVSVLCMIITSMLTDQMGLAVIQLCLLPVLLFGWFRWGSDKHTKPVSNVGWWALPVYIVITVAFYALVLGIANWFEKYDSRLLIATIVFSFIGQLLMVEKKLEAWPIWFCSNAIGLYLFAQAGDTMVMFQYSTFILSNVVGYWYWSLSKPENKIQSG